MKGFLIETEDQITFGLSYDLSKKQDGLMAIGLTSFFKKMSNADDISEDDLSNLLYVKIEGSTEEEIVMGFEHEKKLLLDKFNEYLNKSK